MFTKIEFDSLPTDGSRKSFKTGKPLNVFISKNHTEVVWPSPVTKRMHKIVMIGPMILSARKPTDSPWAKLTVPEEWLIKDWASLLKTFTPCLIRQDECPGLPVVVGYAIVFKIKTQTYAVAMGDNWDHELYEWQDVNRGAAKRKKKAKA